jgi:hypothetical protein
LVSCLNTIYGYSLTYDAVGNVKTDAESAYDQSVGEKAWSWTYNYDTLDRLSNGTSTGAIQFGCSETYDAFGNRTNQVPYGGTGYSCTSSPAPDTPGMNRISTRSYDAAGDILYDGVNTLTCDAEGRISTSPPPASGVTTSYTYDAEGERISKTIGAVETDFVHDLDGNLLDTSMENMKQNIAKAHELFLDAERREEGGDLRGAFRSLMAAAKLGDEMSAVNLGNCYSVGRGVRKDLRRAAYWYKRAYRHGDSTGALNLAIDLEKGGNLRGAIAWLKRAGAMNDGEANLKLARIYVERRNGTAKAIDLLKKTVELSPSHVSDEAREQAEELLKHISLSM